MALHDANAHHCHAVGCDIAVHPKVGFCKDHWENLPWSIQQMLWNTYRPMQEYQKKYSNVYLRALRDGRNYLNMRDALRDSGTIGTECLYCRGEPLTKRCEICLRCPTEYENPSENGSEKEEDNG